MHIAINCRSFINPQYTGIGRYAYNLVKSLKEIDQENDYSLYVPKGLLNRKKKVPKLGGKNFHLKVDRFKRGINKIITGADIYHSPSPDLVRLNDSKIIVTIHDLIYKAYPEGHTASTIEQTDKQLKDIGQWASKIICVSQSTLNDVRKYFTVRDDQLALVHQGVDKNIFYVIGEEEEKTADQLLKSKGVETPFLLSVGTLEPRKNLKNILYAFETLKAQNAFSGKLVVIGMKGWMNDDLDEILSKLHLKNDVVFLGYLSDQELRCFYNKAELFVFPSLYEGFGFPIVESFCCGTPVITSNASSCPEVAADAAMLVDPHDANNIAYGIKELLEDQERQRDLRDKGFKRAGDFNFRKTAEETLEIYKQVNQL